MSAMAIAFLHESKVEYGVATTVSPLIRRVVARNPSPFSYHGTGTYVIGRGNVMIVDPGPELVEHVEALIAALPGERITHQLVTHTHNDHSPAARLVKERIGTPTYGFGPHGEGRFERGHAVEAGGDMAFVPDVTLAHGQVIEGDGFSVEAVHTPGHCSNHLCFAVREERALLTGDHVMSWSTSVISPPDGDMGEYLTSLERVATREDRVLLPAHGPPITTPEPFVRALIAHRHDRERQITSCLEAGIVRIADMVPRMYQGLDPRLYGAAARSVLAHLIHLHERGVVSTDGEPSVRAEFRLR
jgi:glyoxylase-like metal-dependent hydrolase (beta-lactamase superfamily II)